MNRNQRRQARDAKRSHEAGFLGRVASGNHLTADNDEPEPNPGPSEEELLAADVQRSQDKARRFHADNDRRAADLQRAMDYRRGHL